MDWTADDLKAWRSRLRWTQATTETSTLQAGPQSGWSLNAMPCALHADAAGKTVVRRFSPRECLRLQGFSDDWLDGPKLGGRPLSDGDRYRLIGNSWAVPVAPWLLERLLDVDAAR